ncbi:hypothetical protein PHYPSEUDO_003549 [Phytophthora pseudosyringae]|uniref:Uncharacterized protein n=1 Tax=Phytophthora pseudosyringae TaxID=221518 RepID=A0A8T1VUE7_9STRA|nr:hypothetical protein PHYPSEUDO_003549 [Phytophthora pseudosyringae]
MVELLSGSKPFVCTAASDGVNIVVAKMDVSCVSEEEAIEKLTEVEGLVMDEQERRKKKPHQNQQRKDEEAMATIGEMGDGVLMPFAMLSLDAVNAKLREGEAIMVTGSNLDIAQKNELCHLYRELADDTTEKGFKESMLALFGPISQRTFDAIINSPEKEVIARRNAKRMDPSKWLKVEAQFCQVVEARQNADDPMPDMEAWVVTTGILKQTNEAANVSLAWVSRIMKRYGDSLPASAAVVGSQSSTGVDGSLSMIELSNPAVAPSGAGLAAMELENAALKTEQESLMGQLQHQLRVVVPKVWRMENMVASMIADFDRKCQAKQEELGDIAIGLVKDFPALMTPTTPENPIDISAVVTPKNATKRKKRKANDA